MTPVLFHASRPFARDMSAEHVESQGRLIQLKLLGTLCCTMQIVQLYPFRLDDVNTSLQRTTMQLSTVRALAILLPDAFKTMQVLATLLLRSAD